MSLYCLINDYISLAYLSIYIQYILHKVSFHRLLREGLFDFVIQPMNGVLKVLLLAYSINRLLTIGV